jgi:hypothetical protein
MRFLPSVLPSATSAGLLCLMLAACSSSEMVVEGEADSDTPAPPTRPDTRPDAGAPAPDGAGGSDGPPIEVEVGFGPADDAGPTWVELVLEPADLTLVTAPGVRSDPLGVTARLVAGDGTVEVLEPPLGWATAAPEMVQVDGDGQVVATGLRAGTTQVFLDAAGLRASALVRVEIRERRLGEGLDAGVWEAFEAAPLPPSEEGPRWLYPEDGTMFPLGMLPPLLQWDPRGRPWSRLRLTRGSEVEVEVVVAGDRWAPDVALWELLGAAFGEAITVELTTAGPDAPGVVASAGSRTLFTADANLAGSVYYWQIETGDIMRIDEEGGTPTAVFSTNATTGTCRGCHSLSRDGSMLGFMYNGGDNPRAGLARVSAPEPPVIENHSPNQWTMIGFDPTGERGVAVMNGRMWLADLRPGTPGGVADLGTVDVEGLGGWGTMPAWSPDGSTLAWIRRFDGADWSFGSGQLCTMRWDEASGSFVDSRTLLASDAPELDAVSWPSWSPDSRWLAVGQGSGTGDARPALLQLVDPRTGVATRLARANPEGVDVFPSFSPYREGGFYWLLFYSTRPYGHVTATGRKQLWVAAISDDMRPGVDGSWPAFWLPGQDPERQNITGYWAPPVCTNEGEVCKSAEECCAGQDCLPTEDPAVSVCRFTACVRDGRTCATDGDCCGGSSCLPSLTGEPVCQRRF